MIDNESLAMLDARIEKMETRLLRVERRLHLDAPASVSATPPPSPAPPVSPSVSPSALEPSSFAPPIIVPVAPTKPETKSAMETPIARTETIAKTPAPTAATPTPQSAQTQTTPQISSQTPTAQTPSSEKSLLDWEQLVGGKWALWAGVLSIFGAIASFLAYTWRFLPPPPPEAKVALGFLAGLTFLVAGEWTRKRAQRWFCEGLSGAGLAICFLSLWAGGAYFSIFGFAFTFGAMAIVCALGATLAIRNNALSLNILSIIGGFLTPILLRGDGAGGNDTAVMLLSYIAVLNAGVLGVSLFRRWRASVWLSFGATITLLLFWSQGANIDAMRPTVFAFYSLYFLLYVATACFYSLARREETAPEEIGLIIAATTLYAPLAHDLLQPMLRAFPSAFEFGFALFWSALCFLTTRLAPQNRTLRDVFGALGILAFTVAIAIQVAQPWLGVALVGEAAVLTQLARRSDSELLRRGGQIAWFVALFPLVEGLISSGNQTNFGLHAGGWPWLFGLVVTAHLAWSAHRQTEKSDGLRDVYAAFAVAGGAWLVARETLDYGWAPETAGLTLSFYALAIFSLGVRARFDAVRNSAMILALGVASFVTLRSFGDSVPTITPLGNARFVALIFTAGAIYELAWLVRRDETAWLQRAGQFLWGAASLTLFFGMLPPAGEAQLGLHASGFAALFAVVATALFAWSAHRCGEAGEMRDVYAATAVAGGAWLVAREAFAWTDATNVALIALAIYAVAVFALGATTRFTSVRIGASLICAVAAAMAVWLAWLHPAPELTPFWNPRFAALGVTIGALGAIYQLAKTVDFPLHPLEKEAARAFPISLFSLILAAFSGELYFGFAHFAAPQWANRAFFALSIVWSLAALCALSVGIQLRANVWRIWAYGVGGAALASLPINALSNAANWMPFANWRFGAFAVCIVTAGVATWLLAGARKNGVISENETDAIGAFASAALVLALFSLTQETWEMGRLLAPNGDNWQRGAQMAISLVWSLFGALLLAGGVQFRVQGARLGALALLAFTVCKVFLFDLSFLDGAGRALSLGGLGLALIFISWLYGRFGRAASA